MATIQALLSRHRNEDIHTRHVTSLALAIYKQVRKPLSIHPSEKRILEAAGLLHDIGYASDPRRHARQSVEIVLANPIKGFTKRERERIACVILLHQRKVKQALSSPLFGKMRSREGIYKLGAILRVADGLDHGHIQDTSIKSIRVLANKVVIKVESRWYKGNVPWALGKADLWGSTFERRLEIVDAFRARNRWFYHGVAERRDPFLKTMRRILYALFKIVIDSYSATSIRNSPEDLHDLRVAMRRLKAGFKLIQPQLENNNIAGIIRGLTHAGRAMGPVRDKDVWAQFLSDKLQKRWISKNKEWSRYATLQIKTLRRKSAKLNRTLSSKEFGNMLGRIAFFLRVDLSQAVSETNGKGGASAFFQALLSKQSKKLSRYSMPGDQRSSESMHALRKKIRKLRYLSEFAMPIRGTKERRRAVALKRLSDSMGNIHDMDVGMQFISDSTLFNKKEFAKRLQRLRTKHLKEANKHWRKVF